MKTKSYDKNMKNRFTIWTKWEDRNKLEGLEYPGIYAIAFSDDNLINKKYFLCSEIIYFGMTNSKGGLRSRLQQFDNTIIGKTGHGGAHRVRYKYPNYQELVEKLYVSVCSFPCEVTSNTPKDLRIMGEVTKYEYKCFADYVEKYHRLPEFNDKKLSPKK